MLVSVFFSFIEDCTSTTMKLPDLPSEISCNHYHSCNAVTCCMEIAKFNKRTIEVSFNFDDCANFLTLTIERISQTVYLHKLSYGLFLKWQTFGDNSHYVILIFQNSNLILFAVVIYHSLYIHDSFLSLLQEQNINFH